MASFKNSLPRASVDDLVARVKPRYGYRYVPSLGRFVRREEMPDDILDGRKIIAIPEPNLPVIQYAGTGKAPTQGPKAIDTTQHPPSTIEDPIQASIERIRARQKPSPQPGASAQAQIDDFMKGKMQDRRYWDPNQKDDAYRDGVTKLWQLSYPGRYQPGSWGRDDHPAVDLETLRTESRRVLPPGPHKAPGPMQATPLSAKASAPSGQAGQAGNAASPSQAPGRTAGNNSALPQNPNTRAPSTPEARNAFAKGVAEHLGLIPKSPETGVQVAGEWGNPTAWAIGKAGEHIAGTPEHIKKGVENAEGVAAEGILGAASSVGRGLGLDQAADNLDHFLGGSGKDQTFTRDQVRAREHIREAEAENRKRFEDGFLLDRLGDNDAANDVFEYKDKLSKMQDGETLKLPQGPNDSVKGRDYYDVENSTWDHTKNLKLDDALAYGSEKISSKAYDGFTAKREGDTITIEGTVTHEWGDDYDFHGGSSSLLPEAARDHGSAREYRNSATWQQDLTAKFKIKGGELIPESFDWTDRN
jgi:hypothetical protein